MAQERMVGERPGQDSGRCQRLEGGGSRKKEWSSSMCDFLRVCIGTRAGAYICPSDGCEHGTSKPQPHCQIAIRSQLPIDV